MNFEVGGSRHLFDFWGRLRSFFPEILLGEKGIFCNFFQSSGASAPTAPLPPPMGAMKSSTPTKAKADDIRLRRHQRFTLPVFTVLVLKAIDGIAIRTVLVLEEEKKH